MPKTIHQVAYVRGGPEDETGPEMADAAMAVLGAVLNAYPDLKIEFVPINAGSHCFKDHGTVVPDASLKQILDIGVVFKAPTASAKTATSMPVSLKLRKELRTYANVNELRSYPGVPTALRPDIDVLLIRDNSEGLFAMQTGYPNPDMTVDMRFITRQASARIARMGFEYARERRRKLCVCAFPVAVNSDQMFIAASNEVAQEYPDVEYSVRKVDAFAGTVIANPAQYDVVIAPTEWGSIMTDLFAQACGSVGLAARGNLGDTTGYFEPIHGTAPGKTGKGTVNPISQIMAGKIMLDWLGKTRKDATAAKAGATLQRAVSNVLTKGAVRTVDLGGTSKTIDMVNAVIEEVQRLAAAPR